MNPYQNDDFPWKSYPELKPPPKRGNSAMRRGILVCLVCLCIVVSILLTYTLTSSYEREMYHQALAKQEATIKELRELLQSGNGSEFDKLQFLSLLFSQYSYYSESMNEEEIIEAVLKSYVTATGDHYAAYYTEEEYAAMVVDKSGNSVGIGVGIVQDTVIVEGYDYQAFLVTTVYQDSPAQAAGILPNDYIVGVKVDGAFLTIEALGGYDAARYAIAGEIGTTVELLVYRPDGGMHVKKEFSITRAAFVKQSVFGGTSATDPTVGIVRIAEFDMTTPVQFKKAVKELQEKGIQKFVFDVRNNPGGDLQSIKAVLSFILEAGDLVLSAIDNKGNVVRPYYVEEQLYSGEYAPCSVAKEEIGMFRNLDMVVLCNENTASAAEVFTASLRDHKNVPIVGVKTFGKGIMQGFISLASASYGVYDGWVKLTTHAYVTECGVTYHDKGIEPTKAIAPSEEALKYNPYLLPEEMDNQLQGAIAEVNK